MKSNRPINLPLEQVIAVNAKSPIAIASILHRVSGIVLFLLTPILLYMVQTSLQSQAGFEQIAQNMGLRFVLWVFVAATAYHFVMGVKHLVADMGLGEEFAQAKTIATASLGVAAVLIVLSFVWVMF